LNSQISYVSDVKFDHFINNRYFLTIFCLKILTFGANLEVSRVGG